MLKGNFWKHVINVYLVLCSPVDNIEIAPEIYEVCPYSNICNRTAERTFGVGGMVPCCSSCGCDEDCGLRLDCCFDYLDKYKLVEKGEVDCLDATIKNGNDELAIEESNGYYMVYTCSKNKTNTREQRESSDDCHLADEFGNTLIAPVSSLENNAIYVNEKCAACNNLDTIRIKKWNYLFLPEVRHAETTITFDIEQRVEHKHGFIAYIPPSEENWSHKRCFNKYHEVDGCSKSDEWRDMCEQLNAPFQSKRWYRNVFCALCDGKRMELLAKECKFDMFSRYSFQALTILLNNEVIEASKLSNIATATNMEQSENSCPTGYTEHLKSMCLPIYCPEGMLHTDDGCTYFALRWYIPLIIMDIKLLPKQGTILLISQLKSFGEKERTKPFTWLKSPCRKIKLTSIEIYYSTANLGSEFDNQTTNYVTSLLLRLWKSVDMKFGIDPSLIIPMFNKCVRENWNVKLGQETFIFDADLDKHVMTVERDELMLKKWPLYSEWNEGITRPVQYTLLAEGPVNKNLFSLNSVIVLKKPFFCKQVRIPQSDVEIDFGEIRIISRNITVGTNEYLVNAPLMKGNSHKRDRNKTTFSVCIEDYDPRSVESSQNTFHAESSAVICIIVFLPTLLEFMYF